MDKLLNKRIAYCNSLYYITTMSKIGFIIINLLLSSSIVLPLILGVLLLLDINDIYKEIIIFLFLFMSGILFIIQLFFVGFSHKFFPENSRILLFLDKIKNNHNFRFKFLLSILGFDLFWFVILPVIPWLNNSEQPEPFQYVKLLNKYIIIYFFLLGEALLSHISFILFSWIKTGYINKISSRIWPRNKAVEIFIFIFINLLFSSNIIFPLSVVIALLTTIIPCPYACESTMWIAYLFVLSLALTLFIIYPITKLTILFVLYEFLPKSSWTYLLLDKIKHNMTFRIIFLLLILCLDILCIMINCYYFESGILEVYFLLLGGVFISYVSFLFLTWIKSKLSKPSITENPDLKQL